MQYRHMGRWCPQQLAIAYEDPAMLIAHAFSAGTMVVDYFTDPFGLILSGSLLQAAHLSEVLVSSPCPTQLQAQLQASARSVGRQWAGS